MTENINNNIKKANQLKQEKESAAKKLNDQLKDNMSRINIKF